VYIIVWRFRAAPGREAEFERAYGHDGDWATLFRHADGFRGTELLRDAGGRGWYLTIDRWYSAAGWRAFRERWAAEYESLDHACEEFVVAEQRVGAYHDLREGPDG
jgi:heme-degrading monooxygenase HmoA